MPQLGGESLYTDVCISLRGDPKTLLGDPKTTASILLSLEKLETKESESDSKAHVSSLALFHADYTFFLTFFPRAMAELDTVGKILRGNMGCLSMELKKRKVSNSGSREHMSVRLAVATFREILLECRATMDLLLSKWQGNRKTADVADVACSTDDLRELYVQDAECMTELDGEHEPVGTEEMVTTPQKPPPASESSSSEKKASKYELRCGLNTEKVAAEPVVLEECLVCDASECICPRKVKAMAAEAKWPEGLPGKYTSFLCFKQESGKDLLGCRICIAYAAAGHKLRGRQSLGRFELAVHNKNIHQKDTVDEHTRRASGDHQLALEWMKKSKSVKEVEETDVPSGSKCGDRAVSLTGGEEADFAVSAENENLVFLAYESLRCGISGHQFAKLVGACYNVGAHIPRSHLTERFFGELTDLCGMMLFSQVLQELKASPVFSIQTDEGKGHLCIRINYLVDFKPVSRFWQVGSCL